MAIIKTKKEIENIKKACEATDAIFKLLLQQDLQNKTEIELYHFILDEIKKRGLTPSFDPIVASGKNAGSEIHPKPKNSKLSGFTIIDFGVIYNSYMSDMTRTVYIGKPSKEEIALYNKLLGVQVSCVQYSIAGTKTCFLDAQARALLGEDRKYFIHTLGHGVGRKIHEEPKIFYKLEKPVLKENMVITIEPGLYVKGKYGMRIEDTILITKGRPKVLTRSEKKLIII